MVEEKTIYTFDQPLTKYQFSDINLTIVSGYPPMSEDEPTPEPTPTPTPPPGPEPLITHFSLDNSNWTSFKDLTWTEITESTSNRTYYFVIMSGILGIVGNDSRNYTSGYYCNFPQTSTELYLKTKNLSIIKLDLTQGALCFENIKISNLIDINQNLNIDYNIGNDLTNFAYITNIPININQWENATNHNTIGLFYSPESDILIQTLGSKINDRSSFLVYPHHVKTYTLNGTDQSGLMNFGNYDYSYYSFTNASTLFNLHNNSQSDS